LGIWNTLAGWVEQLLSILYGITHNYGLAIIILTLIIRAIMYPLMQKQIVAMRDTQKIQPLIQEIQKKYSHDKERMNQEVMALYKQHKINPMGGCLPLLIQMPILILFFRVLREFKYFIPNTEIIDSGFLWIKNLAAPDELFGVMGNYSIGILPFLVAASMYFQQKLTMSAMPAAGQSSASSSSNPAADTQKIMGTVMPLMIGFISFNLPSGLSLYWLTSTLFDIGQRLIINKKDKNTEAEKKPVADISPEQTVPEQTALEQKPEQKPKKKTQPKPKKPDTSWIPGYETPSAKKTKKQ
jgi:YidC/Oxa1 family membrane protein insertase